jgi:hypothetical protein
VIHDRVLRSCAKPRSTPLGKLDPVIRLFEGNFIGCLSDLAQESRISPRLPWPRTLGDQSLRSSNVVEAVQLHVAISVEDHQTQVEIYQDLAQEAERACRYFHPGSCGVRCSRVLARIVPRTSFRFARCRHSSSANRTSAPCSGSTTVRTRPWNSISRV